MYGIDVDRAAVLVRELQRWPATIDQVAGLVTDAGTLSDIDPGVDAHLGDLSRDGRAVAAAVDTAVQELLAHRLETDSAVDGLQNGEHGLVAAINALAAQAQDLEVQQESDAAAAERAQRLIDRIRADADAHRPPNRSDHDRLQGIFERSIGDDATVAAAMALALGGLPAGEALGYGSVAQIEADFGWVRVAMEGGHAPADVGIHPSLFPRSYRTWHEVNAELDDAQRALELAETAFAARHQDADLARRVQQLTASLDAIELSIGLGASASIGDDGSVDAFDATVAVGVHHGATADVWVGRSLAQQVSSLSPSKLTHTGELIGLKQNVALSFFGDLGASGTARIPAMLLDRGIYESSIDRFVAAFGTATHMPALGFSGTELIEHDLADANPMAAQAHAEILLSSPRIDTAFAVDAVVASLALRPQEIYRWPLAPTAEFGNVYVDPRQTALVAAAQAGVAADVIARLADRSELGLLFEARLQTPSALVPGSDFGPTQLFLGSMAGETERVRTVIEYVNAAEPDLYLSRDLTNGLSAMLALSLPDLAESDADRSAFMDTFRRVVEAGGGFDVIGAGQTAFERDTEERIYRGDSDPDQIGLAQLVGQVDRALFDAHRVDAALADRAAENAIRNRTAAAGLPGLAAGTGSGGVMTVIGVLLSLAAIGLSFLGPKQRREVRALEGRIDVLEQRPAFLQHLRLVAMFESGRVYDSDGHVMNISRSANVDRAGLPRFALEDALSGDTTYEGNFAIDGAGELFDIEAFAHLWFEIESGELVPFRSIPDRYAAADPFFDFD